MRLALSPESRVFIDLRATGLLRAVGHDPTLTARADATTLDPDAGEFEVRFAALEIAPPEDIPPSDREKMRDNLRGAEVLDTARYPSVVMRGRYQGTLERGRLAGTLEVRGTKHPLAMDVRVDRDGEALVAKGTWEGKLTELGIKPFKALLGALKLSDWIRLRVEARLLPC
jgi:hypothetical protein